MNKSNPYTARRGVVGKVITNIHIMHGHTVMSVFCFLSFFFFLSFYPMIRGEKLIYVSPDISRGYDFNYLYVPLAQSNLIYRATASYIEMIHG